MSVKPELAFAVCWEVYRGGAGSAQDQTRDLRAELEGHGEVSVAAGLPRAEVNQGLRAQAAM
jgi:hypothetical protein